MANINSKQLTKKIVDDLTYRLRATQVLEDGQAIGPILTILIEEIVKGILHAVDAIDPSEVQR